MKKNLILVFVISLIGLFGAINSVRAGFGVSPPFINNSHLTPGCSFEETIYLVRGQPTEELIAEVTIEAPEIESWITIEKGLSFPLPKDIQQFPMKVKIQVPQDAAYGNYQGYIRVRAISADSQPGQVTTLIGGRIDLGLTVTEKGFTDFRIKGNPLIPDIEKGNLLVVFIMIENIGNTQVRPSRVHLDIYDIAHLNLLTSGDINEMNSVLSFETSQVRGQMPINLEIGEYWTDITVYKEEKSAGFYRIYFKVIPKVEILAERPKDKGLLFFFWYVLIGIIIAVIAVLLNRSIKKEKAVSDSKETKISKKIKVFEEIKTPTAIRKRKRKTEKNDQ